MKKCFIPMLALTLGLLFSRGFEREDEVIANASVLDETVQDAIDDLYDGQGDTILKQRYMTEYFPTSPTISLLTPMGHAHTRPCPCTFPITTRTGTTR